MQSCYNLIFRCPKFNHFFITRNNHYNSEYHSYHHYHHHCQILSSLFYPKKFLQWRLFNVKIIYVTFIKLFLFVKSLKSLLTISIKCHYNYCNMRNLNAIITAQNLFKLNSNLNCLVHSAYEHIYRCMYSSNSFILFNKQIWKIQHVYAWLIQVRNKFLCIWIIHYRVHFFINIIFPLY